MGLADELNRIETPSQIPVEADIGMVRGEVAFGVVGCVDGRDDCLGSAVSGGPVRWFAAALAVTGAALLVRQAVPGVDLARHIARWWPLGVLLLGIVGLVRLLPTAGAMRGPLFLVAAGSVALLFTVRPLPAWLDPVLVPVLLLSVGIGLLARRVAPAHGALGRPVRREVMVALGRPLTWDPGEQSLLIMRALVSGSQLTVQPPATRPGARGRMEITAALSGINVLVPDGLTIHIDARGVGGRHDILAPQSPTPEEADLTIVVLSAFTTLEVKAA